MLFRHAADAVETEGQLERGSGIFPLLRMCTHGMRRDASETAGLGGTRKRRQA
jgi:hypothetical protein